MISYLFFFLKINEFLQKGNKANMNFLNIVKTFNMVAIERLSAKPKKT